MYLAIADLTFNTQRKYFLWEINCWSYCFRLKDGWFDDFQAWAKNKQKPRLEQSVLSIHAENLFVLLSKRGLKSGIQTW